MIIKASYNQEVINKAEELCSSCNLGSFQKTTYAILCIEDNKIIGALTGYFDNHFTEEYRNNLAKIGVKSKNIGIINEIAVLKEYRKNGIASKLIDAFENECTNKDCEGIGTTTITGGEPILNLLYKKGFTKFTKRKLKKVNTDINELLKEYALRKGIPDAINKAKNYTINLFFQDMGIRIIKGELYYASKETEDLQEPLKNIKEKTIDEILIDTVKPEYNDLYQKLLDVNENEN